MSPTVFSESGFRFHFYTREESRMHIHVRRAGTSAKFWIEPCIELAQNRGMDDRDLRRVKALIEENSDEIRRVWLSIFPR